MKFSWLRLLFIIIFWIAANQLLFFWQQQYRSNPTTTLFILLAVGPFLLYFIFGVFLADRPLFAILKAPRAWRVSPPYIVVAILCAVCYYPVIFYWLLQTLNLLDFLPRQWILALFAGYCLAKAWYPKEIASPQAG